MHNIKNLLTYQYSPNKTLAIVCLLCTMIVFDDVVCNYFLSSTVKREKPLILKNAFLSLSHSSCFTFIAALYICTICINFVTHAILIWICKPLNWRLIEWTCVLVPQISNLFTHNILILDSETAFSFGSYIHFIMV